MICPINFLCSPVDVVEVVGLRTLMRKRSRNVDFTEGADSFLIVLLKCCIKQVQYRPQYQIRGRFKKKKKGICVL